MQLGKGFIDSLLHSSSNQQSKQSQLSSDNSLVDQILELEKKKYSLQRQKGQLDNHDLQYKLQQLQSEVSHLHQGNSSPASLANERRRSRSFTSITESGHPLAPSLSKEERLAALLRKEKETFVENDHFSDDDDSEDDNESLFSYGSRQNSRNYSTENARKISNESFTSSSVRGMSFGPSTGSGAMPGVGSGGATASMPSSASSSNQPLHPLSNRLNYNKMVQQGTVLPSSSLPSSASSSSRPPSTTSSSVAPPQARISLSSTTVNGYTPPRLSTNIRTISKATSNDPDSAGSTALTSFLPPSSEEVIPRSHSEGRNKQMETRLSGDPDLLSGMRTSLADDFDLEFYDSLHQPGSVRSPAELLSPSSGAATAAEAAHTASFNRSSSSSQHSYHDSLLQNLLEFCIIEANWDELTNKTNQFLTPTIPPKLQWRFPPIINETKFLFSFWSEGGNGIESCYGNQNTFI
jgi:hypothetical protein